MFDVSKKDWHVYPLDRDSISFMPLVVTIYISSLLYSGDVLSHEDIQRIAHDFDCYVEWE